jgi:poly(3-hydroxybutyrate) depolymerase
MELRRLYAGGLSGGGVLMAAIASSTEAPWAALAAERAALMARLHAIDAADLSRVVERGEGKPPRTVRRMLRRLLEHEWEHALELRSRLGS